MATDPATRVASHPADGLLDRAARRRTPVCVGLDPVLSRLPDAVRATHDDPVDAIAAFCAAVIEAVATHVPAVKLQSACFERYRGPGFAAMFDLVAIARSLDLTVILDAKRGDIGISAEHYAAASFTPPAADFVTANPYLGDDGLKPFLAGEGGVFALVRTSNPGGDAVQSVELAGGGTVAEHVAGLVATLGASSVGAHGFSRLGAVVGATKAVDARRLREIMPQQIFLVPGFGAQGGGVEDVLPCFHPGGVGAIVTASRSVIYAFDSGDDDWANGVADAAASLGEAVGRAVGLALTIASKAACYTSPRMTVSRLVIFVLFVGLLVLPFAFRTEETTAIAEGSRAVIIITPHNEQIRHEYGRAFETWHQEVYGEPAHVVWNNPGGTSEIRKMLIAQFESALRDGRDPGGNNDLMFGGGSYEHDQLKRGVSVSVDGTERTATISVPADFALSDMDAVYGENAIGSLPLYDPDLHWVGTALSGFGLVYNHDLLNELGVSEPTRWADLCSPALRGWVALVNPSQSGSVTTAFEAILHRCGWRTGWDILRRAGANARYFAANSSRPARDVSMGDAAMGVSIDFYGRYQAQAVMTAGGGDRVGYVDPPGETTIDPDPISVLRGAPNPEMARRFVEFCMTVQAQALWQYPVRDGGVDTLGPTRFELRRMPARRSMYGPPHFDRFIDPVNPFEFVEPLENPNRAVRSFISVMFTAIAMDTHEELRAAWRAIIEHPAYPSTVGIVRADDVEDPTLREMLRCFDAMPIATGPDDASYPLDVEDHLDTIKAGWLRGGWSEAGLWPRNASATDVLRRRFTEFHRDQYRRVVEIGRGATEVATP